MACSDFQWQFTLFMTCLFTMLTMTNLLSMLPINMQEFEKLPKEVQQDFTEHVRNRLSEYKMRLSAHGMTLPREDLLMHLNPQLCLVKGKQPVTGSWPGDMNQYFCASDHLADWCFRDLRLYQTTEKVFTLSNGKELHVSLSCYRMREFNRYLDDLNMPICIITIALVSIVFHSWWANLNNKIREDLGDESSGSPAAPRASPPPLRRSERVKGLEPVAPRPNLRSRHDNFRNRKY
ncbi:hypothetical protein CAEBREN_23932 [Caenorhabditis brenneri]|uniref:Uncharacterized protein n=1 Tax=Caenorhabditis brenneri TaxID=135651 RepID=G0MZP7_CAEBE|nr:hypothetical protein CAEBREN_23932 [Caenorhabditis brenneri]